MAEKYTLSGGTTRHLIYESNPPAALVVIIAVLQKVNKRQNIKGAAG